MTTLTLNRYFGIRKYGISLPSGDLLQTRKPTNKSILIPYALFQQIDNKM